MNKENTQKLLTDFPELYSAQGGLFHYFGFQCGDGWFQIIYDLSIEITATAKQAGATSPVACQVKEKFGGLRFYVSAPGVDIESAMDKAYEKAWVTCEKCGAPGAIIHGRWSRVRCAPCDLEDQKDLIKGA